MNKSEFIEALSAHFEGNRKAAAQALDAVTDTITREVSKGEKVAITGFGAFERKVKKAGWTRNPATGEQIKTKKKTVPKFRPGAQLKDVVSGAKKAAKPPAPAKKASAAKKTTAAKKSSAAAKKTTAKKAPAKKTTAKKTTAAKKAPAKKTTAKRTTAAKKAPAKRTTAAKKAPARRTTARRS